MARDRSLAVKLKADVSNYLAGIKSAGDATRDFTGKVGDSAAKHKADWATVGQSVTVAGLAIAAGVGFAVSRFADFDQAMSAASAATKASARDLASLRDAAMAAGADTQYSATEAAAAITELGKAGLTTAEILDGGLTGALSLAASGQMDVAAAAELSAVAMKQFNLAGDQVGHVADLLSAGAGKAVGSVEDMGMALKQSGLVASQTGVSIEETTGTLAAFASAGLIGSDAGTSFKSMLQRLTPQSKEAADLMKELGLSAYDASGQFVGMSDFAGQLQTKLSKLTVEQRNSALATIFGSDAVRAAAVLYDQGSNGIADWTNKVNDSGFAADQAARLTDNLRGDIERLGGSLDTALIKTGSGANDALRGLAQGLEGAVNWYSELSPEAQKAAVYIGAGTAAVALFGGGLMTAIPKIQAFKVVLVEMGIASEASTARMGNFAKTAGILGAAIGATTVAGAGMKSVWLNTKGASDDAARSLEAYIKGGAEAEHVTELMRNEFTGLGNAVNNVLNPSIWHAGAAGIDEWTTAYGLFGTSATTDSIAFFRQLDVALTDFVKSGKGDQAAKVFGQITEEAKAQGYTLGQVQGLLPGYISSLDQLSMSQGGLNKSVSPTVDTVEDYVQAATAATAATKAYADAINGFASPILDAREANRQWEESIDSAAAALKENGKTLSDSTDKGRENAQALDGMTRAAIDNVGAMQANGESQGRLQQVVSESRSAIEAMAVRFGMSKDEARKYTDQLLSIPAARATQISADTSAATRALQGLFSYWSSRTITLRIAAQQDRVDPGYAGGGHITGPGTGTSDDIPILASNGEYMIKAAAVNHYGVDTLHAINAMRFADGGLISRSAPAASAVSGGASGGVSAGDLAAAVSTAIDGARVELTGIDRISGYAAGQLLTAARRA
jgi:TP901 family phage tail tape measure protein